MDKWFLLIFVPKRGIFFNQKMRLNLKSIDMLKSSIGFLFIFFIASVNLANGQEVREEPEVQRMLETFQELNAKNPTIRGYRIQIIVSSERQKLESTQRKFNRLYPELGSDWSYVRPYYKLKTGAFRSKLDALPTLIKIKKHFSGAIEVIDDIDSKELLKDE